MPLFRRKSEQAEAKVGRVRRCPQCGAPVPASKVVCPDCGWEFDDVTDRHSALQKLSAQLNKSHRILSRKDERDVILNFPIPKSKGDLLELTIFFKSKADSWPYDTKYEECIMKAMQYYSTDKDFVALIEEYKSYIKAKKRRKILDILSNTLWIAVLIGVCIWLVKLSF